jgi:hypothetical protein
VSKVPLPSVLIHGTGFGLRYPWNDAQFIGIVRDGTSLADYLRDQAVMYRQLAERSDDPVVKNELLELASVCEEVANNIEDHQHDGRCYCPSCEVGIEL